MEGEGVFCGISPPMLGLRPMISFRCFVQAPSNGVISKPNCNIFRPVLSLDLTLCLVRYPPDQANEGILGRCTHFRRDA